MWAILIVIYIATLNWSFNKIFSKLGKYNEFLNVIENQEKSRKNQEKWNFIYRSGKIYEI